MSALSKPIYVQRIAKINNTHLGYEDHGIFTAWIDVDYGGSGQGIGLYALDRYNGEDKEREGTKYGMEWIIRLMRACGVGRWEDLKGRTIYVLFKDDDWNSKPVGVEPLPTELGDPFIFADIEDWAGVG